MTVEVRLRPAARAEFHEGIDWYEKSRAGRGALFIASVNSAIERIAEAPKRHPRVHESVRVHSVRGFPYQIYYRLLGDHIVEVLAIFHVRRNPAIWQSR